MFLRHSIIIELCLNTEERGKREKGKTISIIVREIFEEVPEIMKVLLGWESGTEG
jgi:hypothetical protein